MQIRRAPESDRSDLDRALSTWTRRALAPIMLVVIGLVVAGIQGAFSPRQQNRADRLSPRPTPGLRPVEANEGGIDMSNLVRSSSDDAAIDVDTDELDFALDTDPTP